MAKGRRNQLTKQVGEFLVAAELGRRGLIATTFAGNVPVYDIVAADESGRHVLVQVKTINGRSSSASWQFDIRDFVEVTMEGNRQLLGRLVPPPRSNPICILICLDESRNRRDRFFLLCWTELRNIAVALYRRWLKTHGGTRPRKPDSYHCSVHPDELTVFENKWKLLKEKLKQGV